MVPADHRGRRAPSHHRRPQIGRPFGRSRRRPRRIATALSPSGRRYKVGGRRGSAGGGGCGLPWPCRPRRPSARPRPWGGAAEPCGDRIPVQGASPAPGRSRFSRHTASGPAHMPDPAAPGAPPGARERRPTRKIAGEPPSTSLNPRARLLEVRSRGLSDVLAGYPTISWTRPRRNGTGTGSGTGSASTPNRLPADSRTGLARVGTSADRARLA